MLETLIGARVKDPGDEICGKLKHLLPGCVTADDMIAIANKLDLDIFGTYPCGDSF
jgi:hypothetical protein